jgi:putative transposase
MPRRARLAVGGIPWHIIQRGNNRNPCFFRESDYRFYLATLAEQSACFDCDVHAYCLMTNHIHLLITPAAAAGPSLLMKRLSQRYVQYVNSSYGRTGTLWEGRFKSCLAQDDRYALCCYRYIELNPVRAGIVESPDRYLWSSYSSNAWGAPNGILSPHPHYKALGKNQTERCRNYRALFATELEDTEITAIRLATQGNHAIGTRLFMKQLTSRLGRRVGRGKAGRPKIR